MMTIDEVMELMPKASMLATVYLPDGSTAVQGVEASAPEPADVSEEVQKEFGNLPMIMTSWDADLEYTLYWPVEKVDTNGPVTRITGPKGVLELRRRA